MGTNNCLITSILQNILFYVQHKKETHTGLEQHEHKYLIVGWAIPLSKNNLVQLLQQI